MTKNKTPELPPIDQITVIQANRLICADMLRSYAKLVEIGAIEGLDLIWHQEVAKPQGKCVMNANFLQCEMETKLRSAVKAHDEAKAKSIEYVDMTAEVNKHDPCGPDDAPHCPLCCELPETDS